MKDLRIEMTEEVEDLFGGGTVSQPLDAETFAKKITRFIKKEFDYPSKLLLLGLERHE